jgi:hypothetical protein
MFAQGIAAGRRKFDRVKDRRHRRTLDVGHVGVPDRLAVAQAADRHAAFLDVGDHVHFRMVGEERPAERIGSGRIELAEIAAEGEHLRVGKLLAAKAQHEVLEPCRANLREHVGGDRLGEIETADLGAQRFTDFLNAKQVRGAPAGDRRPVSGYRCGWISAAAPGRG